MPLPSGFQIHVHKQIHGIRYPVRQEAGWYAFPVSERQSGFRLLPDADDHAEQYYRHRQHRVHLPGFLLCVPCLQLLRFHHPVQVHRLT